MHKLPLGSLIIPPGAAFEMRRQMYWGSNHYHAARNDRFRKLYGPTTTQEEEAMLPQWDRERIVAYLRAALRNNPVVSGIVMRFALGIGSPNVHVESGSPAEIDQAERFLLRKLSALGYRTRASFADLNIVISSELCIAGEVFVVLTLGGELQVIPSELCGSPENERQRLPGERDGIVFDLSGGQPAFYRFGRRDRHGRIQFSDTTPVPAQFVWHLANIDRAEQIRGVPLLASAIPAIEDLANIVNAKVQQVKNQSALSLFVTKAIDPQLHAELMSLPSASGDYAEQVVSRSDYQEIRAGQIMYGEIGEDVRLLSPNLNAADFDQFQLSRLDAVCAAVGIPPEEAVVGYRRSNYSSARAEKLRWRQVVDLHRQRREPWATHVARMMFERGAALGEYIGPVPSDDDITWGWPPIREIDEERHVRAVTELYNRGLASKKDIHAEGSRYWEQVERQRIREAAFTAKTLREVAAEQGLSVREVQSHLPETWVVTDQESARVADGVDDLYRQQRSEQNSDENSS